MRIAIVLDYSLDLIGGAQRAAVNEAAALVGAGHDVLLVAPRPSRFRPPAGVRTLWTDATRVPALDFPLTADDEDLRESLLHRFRAVRVEAVHLHSEFGHASAAGFAARRLGVPVTHTVHTAYWPAVPRAAAPLVRAVLARLAGPVPCRTANPLLDRTLSTAAAADVVVSPSTHQAQDLAALGLPRPVVLPNCGARTRAPEPLPPIGPLRIAWVGRCVPEKRLLAFVRAAAAAERALPAGLLEVEVVGDGPLLPLARAVGAATAGLRFRGRLDPDGVRDVLDGVHLTALTSAGFDNQPMTVVESVGAGRGVLHCDPRLREGLDRAGVLTRSPRPADIAELLVRLALDPTPVVRAAIGAREAADLFAPATHLRRLLPVLAGARVAAA